MILSDTAIRNRTTVLVLIVLIVVAGAWSYLTLPREAAPDVAIPVIVVTTVYEGVAPADIESSVTNKIEKKLTGLKGVKEVRSASAEGVSIITIEFLPTVRVEEALQYVRDKVDLAQRDLPTDAEEPTLTEINIAEFPILMVNISGDISLVRLKQIADDLEDAIEENIPEVLNVDVLGGLEREIRLEMDPHRVTAYRLAIDELIRLVPSEHVNISAGGLETAGTKFNIRVPSEVAKPEEIDSFVVTTRNGRPIYLPDVARVRDTFKDRAGYARLNGENSITLSVQKRVGANIVEIVDRVNFILDEARRRAPRGVKFQVTLDQSDDIRMMVADLENNILSGLLLVLVVLVVFMGLRSSVIVALAIPLSMLMSFAVLQALGFTLNMVVLFGLILALGMLVDNAIVIVENIHRHRTLGLGKVEAAMKGASEVAWPVITSTATTLAAFSPMIFWPGIMGDFMKYLPITLIITLTSSLFVAMVISPTLCSVISAPARGADGPRGENPVVRGYRALLGGAMKYWYATLAAVMSLLVGLGIAYGKWGFGVELFPDIDPRYGIVNVRMPQGTSLEQTDRLARVIEGRIRPYLGEMKYLVTNVGSAGGSGFMSEDAGGDHIANVTLVFQDFELRKRPSTEAIQEIRALLADLPGAEIKVEKQEEGPPTGAAVTIRIIGKQFSDLEDASKRVRQRIEDIPGLVNLRSDWTATRPELAFEVSRQRAALLGSSPFVIGEYLKAALFGREVGIYRLLTEEYDITLRLPLAFRQSIDGLVERQVPGLGGTPVPLSSLGEFRYTGGKGTIRHINQKPVITLSADAEGRQGEEVLRDVQARLAGLGLPGGVEIKYAGEKEEQDKAQAFLLKAFVIALLLIVIILVMQFNTLSAPLIIMTTVVLSMIGVLAGLLICHMPFGVIMTGVGVISLAGVVVNNAIVLLDYTRQLQRRGMDVLAAALQAGATRLRPVFLTAVTTILGLIPMATGVSFDFHKMAVATRSDSSQWWASMAIAVIFGLAFATLLTLIVVPTLYVSLYRLAARLGLGGLRHAAEPQPAPHPELEDF
ncbi:MAG TPA: efflux RND transporter permease subunit [Phycisphaerae bacterium]|nr:efflux RND transporter permease subunit [Phycisphaerae bacterium]